MNAVGHGVTWGYTARGRETLPEKPYRLVIVRVEEPTWPAWRIIDEGLAVTVKLGGLDRTTRVVVVE